MQYQRSVCYNKACSIDRDRVENVSSLCTMKIECALISSCGILIDIADTWSVVNMNPELFVPMKTNECVLHETESQALQGDELQWPKVLLIDSSCPVLANVPKKKYWIILHSKEKHTVYK